MKTKIFTFQRSLIMSLLTLLGFASACSEKEPTDMYASPYAVYNIKVKVIDTKGNAIPDIKVSYQDLKPNSYPVLPPTITNQDGESRAYGDVLPNVDQLVVSFEDIDGEKNGLFDNQDTTLDVKLIKKESDNRGGFYSGSYNADLIVTLRNKS